MTIKDLLNEKDLNYLKHIEDYLNNLISDIYTEPKKNYLFYAKKLNEMDVMYLEYSNIVNRLVDKLKKYALKDASESLILGGTGIAFLAGSFIHLAFLIPSVMCYFRASRLARETFLYNRDENTNKLIEPLVQIETRMKLYDDVMLMSI